MKYVEAKAAMHAVKLPRLSGILLEQEVYFHGWGLKL